MRGVAGVHNRAENFRGKKEYRGGRFGGGRGTVPSLQFATTSGLGTSVDYSDP